MGGKEETHKKLTMENQKFEQHQSESKNTHQLKFVRKKRKCICSAEIKKVWKVRFFEKSLTERLIDASNEAPAEKVDATPANASTKKIRSDGSSRMQTSKRPAGPWISKQALQAA